MNRSVLGASGCGVITGLGVIRAKKGELVFTAAGGFYSRAPIDARPEVQVRMSNVITITERSNLG